VQQVEQWQEERNNKDVFVMLRKERGKEGMGY
jgi:hypothetical protein